METLEFSFVSKGQSSHLTIPPQTRAKFWVCTNLLRGLRANQNDYIQRMNRQAAFLLKKNATCPNSPGSTYSDFALGSGLLSLPSLFF